MHTILSQHCAWLLAQQHFLKYFYHLRFRCAQLLQETRPQARFLRTFSWCYLDFAKIMKQVDLKKQNRVFCLQKVFCRIPVSLRWPCRAVQRVYARFFSSSSAGPLWAMNGLFVVHMLFWKQSLECFSFQFLCVRELCGTPRPAWKRVR